MSTRAFVALISLITALVSSVLLIGYGDRSPAEVPAITVEIGGDTLPTGELPAEVVRFLDEGRSWRASRAVRDYLDGMTDPSPEIVLVAARAEAEWGGWEAARNYLEGRDWLDDAWGGQGWYWLGRAREEDGASAEAIDAYERYLKLTADAPHDDRSIVAELRRGLVLLRLGRSEEGTRALDAVRMRAPYLADWMAVLSAEALGASGDSAGARSAMVDLPSSAGMRQRGRIAVINAYETAGDIAGAMAVALAFRAEGGTAIERAALSTAAGRFALDMGDQTRAREALGSAMELAPGSAAARQAATLLLRVPDLTRAERLTIARIDERHGNAARAAEGFRAVLAAGGGTAAGDDQIRLALGRALFNSGQFSAAETILGQIQDAAAPVAREALLLSGRSEYRRGNRQQAFRTFRVLAERFPGSVEGSEGLFLVADLEHDDGALDTAARTYREVADLFPGTDRAGLAMMRLAGIRYLARDYPGAAVIWEEYRNRYPQGVRWLQSTYWAGRALEEMGEGGRAAELYRAARSREPLSYYALLAADRLGEPYWPIPLAPDPSLDDTGAEEVAVWMRGVDLLREAGLHGEADAEAQRLAEQAGEEARLLYPLAEALNDRGYAIRGIRVGQQLERSEGAMNQRLLRILYPWPYRELIMAEAEEKGLDPFVVAALTRQESLFTARITSPAGARGLMQVMPETGAALARGIQLPAWDPELLFQPEINVHLGTRYLAEQMDRYNGSLPSVFSAYNAGPHRIDAWSAFPEYGREELFTERIPYRETRDYVKILTRNIAVYQGLYGRGDRTAAESR